MAGNGKSAKPRKIPLRRCTGCGESFPKKELIRVVRGPDGTVSLDFTGKAGGRGAYVCKKTACFKKARKQNRFKTALEVNIPDEDFFAPVVHTSFHENYGKRSAFVSDKFTLLVPEVMWYPTAVPPVEMQASKEVNFTAYTLRVKKPGEMTVSTMHIGRTVVHKRVLLCVHACTLLRFSTNYLAIFVQVLHIFRELFVSLSYAR